MAAASDTAVDLAAAAAVYAEEGWRLVPLRGKRPLTVHGVDDASGDLEQITDWWRRWPAANIGAAIPPAMFVVDVDPRNGGEASWRQVARGRDVHTLTVISGRGVGWHHWLRRPDGPLRSDLGAGVDVKRRGYCVLPPSVHPETGLCYRWANRLPIAVPPGWLSAALRPDPPKRPTSLTNGCHSGGRWTPDGLVNVVAAADEGERNQRLYWASCRVLDDVDAGRVSPGDGDAALDRLASAAVARGLDGREASRTVASARKRR